MKVLVTGAGGHLGFNLVNALLGAGHAVRGSIRSRADAAAVARLETLGSVEVVGARLESDAELLAAMEGMDAVMHTAAVYLLFAPGREDEIVAASVDGVDRAMRAAKAARVGRVVLTSSVVALPLRPRGAQPATEADWASDLRVPYFRAKTRAEQRAWDLAGELGIDLVTVLPGAFAGPGFVRNTPTIDLFEAIMKGAMEIAAPPVVYPYVDVRDVAEAHLLALAPTAEGRYIAVAEPLPTLAEIARLMHSIDTSIRPPLMTLPSFVLPALPFLETVNSWIKKTPRTLTPEMAATMRSGRFDMTSARIRSELGWAPKVSLRQSLSDTMTALRGKAG
ncbi:MAG: NAD-dependent epimerase/dehydratase family protein [Hyphomicrobiaceae bacterium]|nr:NAD-dependent epimerase/dehydratase family protein [Hyphomicrobiaceae bacterium]